MRVGSVVELNEGIFGGMRGVVMNMGELRNPEGPESVMLCQVGVIGFPPDMEFLCPDTELTVVGEVR